ncbi:hypothetical protein H0H81_004376 [Sphagnurus paluster]|uniref:Uncharacterized protein n=1 Tax=Sphagnurus paluster TaxID=117069 RepID=A0A9P7K281_9AGAR|nr:hypothetical protein H0H81_004376 [Sphagnurus paluster]
MSIRVRPAPEPTLMRGHSTPQYFMVLDAGHIVEFDRPGVLLAKGKKEGEKGYLRALVDECTAEERARLWAAAGVAEPGL